ncbi:hypothetical protein [Neomegalonema sp.]|uniref:hypothetical protein n=1 Tax=Neomegalonema sp. TaxID=2039713 RepID=UPI002629095F|nr:hypothetical protein [Neomegalonema sp.]MDD2867156.1 hypothetical protein [Neomegalonema sp.]
MTHGWDGEAFLHGSEVTLTQRLLLCGLGFGIFLMAFMAAFFPQKGPVLSERDGFSLLISLIILLIGPTLILGGLIWRSTFIRVSRNRIEVESASVFNAFEGVYGPQDVLWMHLRGFKGRHDWGPDVSWRLTLATADGRKHDTLLFRDRDKALEVIGEMERSFFGPRGGAFPRATKAEAARDSYR